MNKIFYKKGYSILEMVIAVSILVILLIILSNIFLRSAQEGQETSGSREVIDQARDIIFSIKQNLEHANTVAVPSGCHNPNENYPRAYSQLDETQIVFMSGTHICFGYVWKQDTVDTDGDGILLGRLFQLVDVASGDPTVIPLTSNKVNVTDVRFKISDDIPNNAFPNVTGYMTFDAVDPDIPFSPLTLQFNAGITYTQ